MKIPKKTITKENKHEYKYKLEKSIYLLENNQAYLFLKVGWLCISDLMFSAVTLSLSILSKERIKALIAECSAPGVSSLTSVTDIAVVILLVNQRSQSKGTY